MLFNSKQRVHYATQLFRPKQEERYRQLLHCIETNSRFRQVSKISVFTDHCELPSTDARFNCIPIDRRATYADFLALLSESSDDFDYFVFSNTDILLTWKFFHLLPHITLPSTLSCLTRREINRALPKDIDPAYTQDAWILRSQRFNSQLVDRLQNIALGIAGCENIFASTMYAYGYNLWNPSLDCPIIHYDREPIRYPPGCPVGGYRYYGMYAFVSPCYMREVEASDSTPSFVLCRSPNEYTHLRC